MATTMHFDADAGRHDNANAKFTQQRRVQCPSCGAVLSYQPDTRFTHARCSKCGSRFELPTCAISEDAVAAWLDEGEDAPKFVKPPEPVAPTPAAQQLIDAYSDIEVHAVKCDRSGVLLQFPSRLLMEPRFRLAMPRRCMQCGTRSHLEAHVIIFSSTLKNSVSLEAEHLAGKMTLAGEQAKLLAGQALLECLPRVPNVPPPADLPMPYWLCDMCSESGSVCGQYEPCENPAEGRCHLFISKLRRAEEFLEALGARGTPSFNLVAHTRGEIGDNPWDSLSLVVQNRLGQWSKPHEDEMFLGYAPDRDLARTEDGMAGLVLTNKRMLHHSRLRHHEVTCDDPLEIKLTTADGTHLINISSAKWSAALKLDGEGLVMLRRGLTKGMFRVLWH